MRTSSSSHSTSRKCDLSVGGITTLVFGRCCFDFCFDFIILLKKFFALIYTYFYDYFERATKTLRDHMKHPLYFFTLLAISILEPSSSYILCQFPCFQRIFYWHSKKKIKELKLEYHNIEILPCFTFKTVISNRTWSTILFLL